MPHKNAFGTLGYHYITCHRKSIMLQFVLIKTLFEGGMWYTWESAR